MREEDFYQVNEIDDYIIEDNKVELYVKNDLVDVLEFEALLNYWLLENDKRKFTRIK